MKNLPLKWGATEMVKWKVAVAGKGWSSPALSKGKIYLTTAVAEGGDQDAARVDRALRVLCFDSETGQILWDKKVIEQSGAEAPKIHKKNSHASPTAIVEGERIYAHFGHMGTACLDLDGEVLWTKRDLDYPPLHGNGGSPLIVGDLLIFSADASKAPFIVALDKKSGEVVWKKPRPDTTASRKFSFSTPTVIDVGGGSQLVSPASGAVFAYAPDTGEEIWRVDYGDGYSVIPKPVFHDGRLFVATGYNQPKVLGIRVDADSKGNVTETHLEWEITKRGPHTPSMLVIDGLLYFISDGGIASCVDPASGDAIWQERAAGPMSASPIYAAGRIYFLDEKGVCTVVNAGREFEVLAKNDIGERTLASMAVDEGATYLRSETSLYRIGE